MSKECLHSAKTITDGGRLGGVMVAVATKTVI